MDKDALRADGLHLRDARVAANMTLQELANASGVGWSTIQAIECGRTPGKLTDKTKLAGALRLSFQVLFPTTHEAVSGILASAPARLDGRSMRTKRAK